MAPHIVVKGMDNPLMTPLIASAFVESLEWGILNPIPHSPKYMAAKFEHYSKNII